MKRITFCLSAVLIFASINLYAQYEPNAGVSIYTDASAEHLGRAEDRSRLISVELEEFAGSDSLDVPGPGIETAVLVDSSVKEALDQMLENRDYVIVENSLFTKTKTSFGDVYGFSWDRYGFEISFMFQKPGARLIDEIEKVYGSDAYLYGELRRSYEDNYCIKILRAENVLTPQDESIDFREAMLSATVIGSTFQPMLGIRDGIGVLNMLGLAAVKYKSGTNEEFIDYRDFEKNGDGIYSFLHTISGQNGDFIDNLYSSFEGMTRKISDDGHMQLPEEFFETRVGDNTDFALFYYDILKRNSYQVKFIVIDPGDANLYCTVFFRETGTDLWGRIDGNSLDREWATKWQRLPALVFTASVQYFEPSIEDVFFQRKIILPPPSEWKRSLY